MSKLKLKLPKLEEQTPVAKILGVYKPNPQQVVVDYKGKKRNWDIQWLDELEQTGQIEVLNEEGDQFKFVGGTSQQAEIGEDDIEPWA